MTKVIVERSTELAASAARVWDVVADTDRLNREVGLSPLEISTLSDASAARYVVRTISAGFPLVYEERPFEFAKHRYFAVRRTVRKGALRQIDNLYRLEPLPNGGTRVTIRLEVEPRFALLAPIVRMQSRAVIDRMLAALARLSSEPRASVAGIGAVPEPRLSSVALARAARELLQRTPAEERQLATALLTFVERASDLELERIRPFELSDLLSASREGTLSLCLRAVLSGLFELRWELICPSCHTSSAVVAGLDELDPQAGCQLCEINFDVELDRAVEATFRPLPAIRELRGGPYCIGGPSRTPHVVVQAVLAPFATEQIRVPSQPDRYRVFVRGGITAMLQVDPTAAPSATLEVGASEASPAELHIAPDGELQVRHADPRERHLKIEHVTELQRAASAQILATLPEFRRTFGSQILRPGVSLRVSSAALLFTDLTASTALYSEIGDARAWALVQDHFDALGGVAAAHGGTIIKTIGDAIMAVFVDPARAMDGAIAMHRAFDALRAKNADARHTSLKVGVYAGPCYAVTSNGRLDYFGQSVNIAARLQAQADPGEIVTTQALADETVARGGIDAARVREQFDATLKGLSSPVRAARIMVDDHAAR